MRQPAVCTVWWANLDSMASVPLALLNEVEKGRYEAFAAPADQDRFALGATILRLAAAEATGVAPEDIEVDRLCPRCQRQHGKPSVRGVEVSVSHAGDLVAVAVTGAGAVGVDVERHRVFDWRSLVPNLVAPQEVEPSTTEEFFVQWTRKESVVKATGAGLRTPMREVLLASVGSRPVLLGYRGGTVAATMADLVPPSTGYAASLTVLGDLELEVLERDAAHLLQGHRSDRAGAVGDGAADGTLAGPQEH